MTIQLLNYKQRRILQLSSNRFGVELLDKTFGGESIDKRSTEISARDLAELLNNGWTYKVFGAKQPSTIEELTELIESIKKG